MLRILWLLLPLAAYGQLSASEWFVVKQAKIQIYENLIGRVTLNQERLSHINPRYAGIVTNVFADVGDEVKTGQKLAVVERNIGLQNYFVRAASSGRIITRNLSIGASVDPSHLAFTIADLSQLWVEVAIKPRLLDQVAVGDMIPVTTEQQPKPILGEVFYKSPFIDSHTRSGTLLLRLPSGTTDLHPGVFVDAHLPSTTKAVMAAIPESAMYVRDGEVLVQVIEAKELIPRKIKIGARDFQNVEVVEGLKSGDQVSPVFNETLVVQSGHTNDEHEEGETGSHDHSDHDHRENN